MFAIVDVLGRPDIINAAVARPDMVMGSFAVAMGVLALLGTFWFARRSRRRMTELADDYDRRVAEQRQKYVSCLETIAEQKRRIAELSHALSLVKTRSSNGVGSSAPKLAEPPADRTENPADSGEIGQ